MISKSDLETYLGRKLSLSTFPVLSKIMYGITNQNTFLELMNFLVLGYTTLEEINSSLEFFSNENVQEFLTGVKNRIGYDKTITINPTSSFNAYAYLTSNDIFPSLLKQLSINLTDKVRPVNFFPYIVYNAINGSEYTSLEDFKLSFEQNVVSILLQKYSISDVSSLVPSITLVSIGNSAAEVTIFNELTRLKGELLKEFTDHFKNSDLFNFFISTPENPSVSNSLFSKHTDLLAFDKYSDITLTLFRNEIGKISNLAVLPPNDSYLTEISNRFKQISFTSNVSTTFATMEFLVGLVNCYKLNNQLGINVNLTNNLKSFADGIVKLQSISNEVMELSAKRLDIRN